MIDYGIFQRELDSIWMKFDALNSKPFCATAEFFYSKYRKGLFYQNNFF